MKSSEYYSCLFCFYPYYLILAVFYLVFLLLVLNSACAFERRNPGGRQGAPEKCVSVSITSLGVTAAGTSVNRCDPWNTAPRCRWEHLLSPQEPGNYLLGSTGGAFSLQEGLTPQPSPALHQGPLPGHPHSQVPMSWDRKCL